VEDKDYPQSQEAESLNLKRFHKLNQDLIDLKVSLPHLSKISLDDDQEFFKLSVGNRSTQFNINQLRCIESWLRPIFKNHNQILENNLDHLEKSRKSYSQFRKKLLSHFRNLQSTDNNIESLKSYFEEEQVRELYNAIHNLQSLPSFLLTLQVFKSFSICQILSHEKGQAFANNNFSSSGQRSNSEQINVEMFNKVFQSIKKSKNRTFNKQSYNQQSIEPIGTFMAKTFTSSRYNIVLILGRNDFLPPSNDELESFYEVANHLEPVLNAILRRSSQDDKISNIIDVLENIPLPLSITNRSDSFLFKNEPFENLKEADLKDYKCLEKELFGKNILRLYFNPGNREDTDLYHFYRVSLLGELLNTLRHELSNPLFGLSLAADFFQDSKLEPEIQETIADIKTNSERCQTIIKNFSSLYQEEENFKSFDLISLLKETIILTKSETKGIRKEVISSCDDLMIYSNPTWISQIIFNLIINAGQAIQEFTPQNQLRNSFINVVVEQKKGLTFIHVKDNGPGIPTEIKDKVFNAFVTTKDSGTGLGLAICKNLLKKLQGGLIFTSNKEGGVTFTVSLPMEIL
jgi:two-component system NtrC family sensor kinase